MPRRVPNSAKKKRTKIQKKRAVKRGDVSPPPQNERRRRNAYRKPVIAPSGEVIAARRLQSSLVKLSPEFLQETRRLSATLPLPRPIPPEAAAWSLLQDAGTQNTDVNRDKHGRPTCPKRPKWRYEMSKKELEQNEQGFFKKWLDQTDSIIENWCKPVDNQTSTDDPSNEAIVPTQEPEVMPKARASFERNLEVWRQLWRVTEISQIILVLLDCRCPLIHYPPSLATLLSSPEFSRKRIILVLTKVDIAGQDRANAWTQYLQGQHPHVRIVQVESYVEKQGTVNGKRAYEPHLPSAFRQTLVEALKEAHRELLEPPEQIKTNPEQAKNWKSSVKREVDWNAVLNARGGQVGTVIGEPGASKSHGPHTDDESDKEGQKDTEGHEEEEPEFLTVGFIGQPNVGKSSLLNALFGTQKVRASRAPGKTRHFQTLFWTPEVRLVDCPGLIMPELVPMEAQVLSGILPISRVAAVPLCIYHAASLLPLETILSIPHPSVSEPKQEDKRTWRVPRSEIPSVNTEKPLVWTAMDILTQFAVKKGWVTAQAGRPDINRAGNWILRALAEGRIKWAFWPPETPASVIQAHQKEGEGIWIRSAEGEGENYDEFDYDSTGEGHEEHSDEEHSGDSEDDSEVSEDDDDDEDDEEEEGDEEDEAAVKVTSSRFNALATDDLYEGEGDDSEQAER